MAANFPWVAPTSQGWHPGPRSGHRDYEIHDVLVTADGRCVAELECFSMRPHVFYCNALTPEGQHHRLGGGYRDLVGAKLWAERITGLSVKPPEKTDAARND